MNECPRHEADRVYLYKDINSIPGELGRTQATMTGETVFAILMGLHGTTFTTDELVSLWSISCR